MPLTHSFQGRFLIVAALLGIALLAMVLYTKKMVSNDTRDSRVLISEYMIAEESIQQISDLYKTLKRSLYQYTLLLTPELKAQTLDTIETLKKRSGIFKNSNFFKYYPSAKGFTAELEVVIRLLNDEVKQTLRLQESAVTRYPAVRVLLDEVQPGNRYFKEQLTLARDEANDVRSRERGKIIMLLNETRIQWEKRVSEVRLFVANRSGAFGDAKKVLPRNLESVEVYGDQVDNLLYEVRELSRNLDRVVVLKEALDEMIVTNRRYSLAFKRAAKLFMQEDWRADVYHLESRVEPLIKQNEELLNSIEGELSSQMGQMIKNSLETSTLVTTYISWFVTAVYFLIMLAYFLFEKSIRQPLIEVSKALDAHGNNEVYDIIPKQYYVTESEVLIEAFEGMKEQVNSRTLRLQTILQNVADGIVISDRQGIIETFNPAAERLFGMLSKDVVNKSVNVLLGAGSSISEEDWLKVMQGKLKTQHDLSEMRLVKPTGEMFYAAINSSSMSHQGQIYYISVVVDVSEHKALTDDLQNLADMDTLTSLYNRRYFTSELDRLVERAHRRKFYSFALLFIDLDNFKYINDSYGHHVGDRVLIEVSTLLQGKVRKGDLLARLGGDEFAVILYDVNRETSIGIANKYLEQISGFTFYEQGKVLDVGCSVGVGMIDKSIKNKDDFLMRADYACQLAKQSGRNRVYAYSNDDDQSKDQMLGHIGIAQTIRDAIRKDNFRLLMQPIRSTVNNKVFCYELLLRMIGENGQDIMPHGFLSSAERFNLMIDIDRWVVRHAVHLLSGYHQNDSGMIVSINLSAQSLGDIEIIKIIEEALDRFSFPASALLFEITESVAISHMDKACKFLEYLRDLGCKTALDDFGAGYSSYAYLKDLPADYVKIDGAFVLDIDTNELNLAMVKSMHDIATVMGKKTIAEFVENAAVLNLLKDIGIDYVQGNFLGKPSSEPLVNHNDNIIPLR